MSSTRTWLDPATRLLARRLDQLRSTLDSLGSRLRAAVSTAVGESVGVIVRDAIDSALDHVTKPLPDLSHRPALTGRWDQEDDQDLWYDDAWEGDEPEPSANAQPDEQSPKRLARSVSAGLHAAAWWLRRWTGGSGLVSTAAVGLVATGTVYVVPALATVGMSLIGAAGQLAVLSNMVRSLTGT